MQNVNVWFMCFACTWTLSKHNNGYSKLPILRAGKYNNNVVIPYKRTALQIGQRNIKIHSGNLMDRYKSWTTQSSANKNWTVFIVCWLYLSTVTRNKEKKPSWISFSAFQRHIIFRLAPHAWGLTATCSWQSKQNKCGHSERRAISSKLLPQSKQKQCQSPTTVPPFP